MTSVQPPRRTPFAVAGVSTPVQASAQGGDVDFASLLSREGPDEDRRLSAERPAESRQSELEAGLANVFNAFGFFQAGPETVVSNQRDRAAAAPTPDYESLRSGERAAETARLASAPKAPPGEPRSSAAQRAVSLNSSALPPVEQSSGHEFGLALVDVHRSPGASAQISPSLPRAPGRLSAPSVNTRSPTGASASIWTGRDMSLRAPESARAKSPNRASADNADRLTFRVGEQTVEFIGRLEGLSEDDEKKMIEALAELLAGHGLSLGQVTLNGRAVGLRMSGGEK